jgi:hypothetical protein
MEVRDPDPAPSSQITRRPFVTYTGDDGVLTLSHACPSANRRRRQHRPRRHTDADADAYADAHADTGRDAHADPDADPEDSVGGETATPDNTLPPTDTLGGQSHPGGSSAWPCWSS